MNLKSLWQLLENLGIVISISEFAKTVRTFLGFAALFIGILASLFFLCFSQGSFDTLVKRVDELSGEQFFWLVTIVLFMLCVNFFNYSFIHSYKKRL